MKLPYVIMNQISKEENAIIQEKYGNLEDSSAKKSLREYPNPLPQIFLAMLVR